MYLNTRKHLDNSYVRINLCNSNLRIYHTYLVDIKNIKVSIPCCDINQLQTSQTYLAKITIKDK